MKRLAILLMCCAVSPVMAQKAPEPTSEAMETGATAGRVAGNADFCNAEEDDLEDFVTWAHAQIAIAAKDKLDQVLGELEFSNHYSITKTRQPAESCAVILKNFRAKLDDLK